MKLHRLFLLLVALLAVFVCSAAEPARSFYDKTECQIAMRDHTRLYTAIYAPKYGPPAPIIIFRTPYSCSPYGEGQFPDAFEKGYMRSYLDRGYIVVMQDVRGRFMSEGYFVHVRPKGVGPVDEATDSYDTVEWLIRNVPNNNGRVGFAGSSYPGFYAMMGGLSGHPAVKAVSPQAPVTDWFMGDDVHHNGVLMLADSYRFLSGMNTPRIRIPSRESIVTGRRTEPDEWSFFMQHRSLAEVTGLIGRNDFWTDMTEHPDYDSWWQERNLLKVCRDVCPAVLVVGGTFDAEDCYGAWNLFRALRKQSPSTSAFLVIGPWAHGAWRNTSGKLGDFDFGREASWQYYMKHFEVPFFDYYLWGKPDRDLDFGSRSDAPTNEDQKRESKSGAEASLIAPYSTSKGRSARRRNRMIRRANALAVKKGKTNRKQSADVLTLPEVAVFTSGDNRWHEFNSWLPREAKRQTFFLTEDGLLGTKAPKSGKSSTSYLSDPSNPVPYRAKFSTYRPKEYMVADQRFVSDRSDVLTFATEPLADSLTLIGPVDVALHVQTSLPSADFVVKLIDVYPDDGPMQSYQMLIRGDVMRSDYRNSFSQPEFFTPDQAAVVPFRMTDIAHTFLPGHRVMIQVQSSWFPLVELNSQTALDRWTVHSSQFEKGTISVLHERNNPSSVAVWQLPAK